VLRLGAGEGRYPPVVASSHIATVELIADVLSPGSIPAAFFDQPDGTTSDGCGIFDSVIELDISAEDGRRIREKGRDLNAALRAAAQAHGWIFVDGIEAGFSGHGYCSDDSFFVFAEDSCRQQGDFEGTMHANASGHAVYSRYLEAALTRRLFSRDPILPPKPNQQVPDETLPVETENGLA